MSFLNDLNPRQREAITALQGPVMVVAGPGSGKTRVLTYRIAHLMSTGVPAYNILALTFTNKAAREMMERIRSLVGERSGSIWMGTFHSLFARILRMECEAIGFKKNFSIYDTIDSGALIRTIMADLRLPTQQYNPHAIRSRISAAKNQMVSPETFARNAADLFEETTARVYTRYRNSLEHHNAMDFDDLLLRPIQLFSEKSKILEKYQDRFRFILVDEYQDTNKAQYVLINMLARRHRNLCVVGDDAQSIYAFRGADIRNILDFQRDYPDAVMVRLEQNYRSTANILNAANQVIRNNVDQIAKTIWTSNPGGDPISVIVCPDDREEGASVVRSVFNLTQRQPLSYRDIAVMYRTNAQSRALEDALRRASIPYTIVGGVEFYQRKEVKDVLAYLRLLVNPLDEESLLRVINYPARGLGDTAIARLRQFAESGKMPLFDALARAGEIVGMTPRAKESFLGFSAMIGKYRGMLGEMSASETSLALIDETGILRLMKDEGTPESLVRWENIQELLSAITEFTANRSGATLEEFLQDVSLVADVDSWDDASNAVTLMTLHAAKGLEFPVVFIAGLEEGLLPFYSATPDRHELEEERRLFYVGMTRAKQKLVLTWARSRYRFAEVTSQTKSRFLDEISPDLLESLGEYRSSFVTERRSPLRSHRTVQPRKRSEPDAQYYRDPIPDHDESDLVHERLKAGGSVLHETFGRGRVIQVSGTGDSLKAVIDFPAVGRKNLLLKYARLKLL